MEVAVAVAWVGLVDLVGSADLEAVEDLKAVAAAEPEREASEAVALEEVDSAAVSFRQRSYRRQRPWQVFHPCSATTSSTRIISDDGVRAERQ